MASSHAGEDEELLIPPDNFAMVEPGIYRSGFPGKKNFAFLRTLGLRSVLYLCPEDYPEANLAFFTQQHVQLMQYGVAGNKEPNIEMPYDLISESLVFVLDTRNHPVLIHCNKGKHRTGCMVGVLRRALGWNLASVFEEYRLFSRPKERLMDQQWIELWSMTLPDTHPVAQRERRRRERERKRKEKEEAGEVVAEQEEAEEPLPLPDYTPFLLNPEANLHFQQRQEKEKERESARSKESSSSSLLALQHAASEKAIGATKRPLSAQHHHTHSHPNLSAVINNRQT